MAVGRQADDEAFESIDLPDEAATAALARWLAGFARAGDFIALSGDLGAGKTAFARGYLRALTGQAELEAPSPKVWLAFSAGTSTEKTGTTLWPCPRCHR